METPRTLPDLTARTKALDFVRWASCIGTVDMTKESPVQMFARRWPRATYLASLQRDADTFSKAAVTGGTQNDANWAGSLMAAEAGAAFVAYQHPATLIAKLGLRSVPFNTPVPRSTIPMSAYWAGVGTPKPLTRGDIDGATLPPATAAAVVVLSQPLLRFSRPGSEAFVRDELAAGLTAFLDAQLVDPTNAGVADQYPASITNGVAAAASSGGDVHEDIRELLTAYLAAGGAIGSAVILISERNAVALASRSGAGGFPVFPNLTRSGGIIAGLPALASDAVGQQLIMVDARGVIVADEQGMENEQFLEQFARNRSVSPSAHGRCRTNSEPTVPCDTPCRRSSKCRGLSG